jgi:predicted ribosome quality control (RQC) complex YloA/Tae2 family protein
LDNLVLIRVTAALDERLARSVLRDFREESLHRFRLIFEGEDRTRSVLVSLRPELPWIGRPVGRWEGPSPRPSSFAATCRKQLRGAVLERGEKPSFDRVVRLRFAEGRALVAELATHGANLVLLDSEGGTVACARRSKSSQRRLAPGTEYLPPEIPRRLLVPHGQEPEAIDRYIRRCVEEGESVFETLRRRLFGVGSEGARLVVDEACSTGRNPAEVLVERLGSLERGEIDPVIEAPEDPLDGADRGVLDPNGVRLLPWEPPASSIGPAPHRQPDPAATAGRYHEAIERMVLVGERARGLLSVLSRETERLKVAAERAERDLESFEDPERHKRWGEALLAGLGRARRAAGAAFVPDPYDSDGAEIAVPVPGGLSLQDAASSHFRQHRRAKRGLERAAERRRHVVDRLGRLERLAVRFEAARGQEALDALETAMRAERIPVGLQWTVRARAAARMSRPRLEGARIYRTIDGLTLLAGRSGRDNHRLTFKLSAPDDFWFHAQGCRGAHVVLRNERRLARPPQSSLEQAAALAAWFSQAKDQEFVEVQWTRRKNVRKPRGASPGTVVLKRFETIRVRPALPEDQIDPAPPEKFA